MPGLCVAALAVARPAAASAAAQPMPMHGDAKVRTTWLDDEQVTCGAFLAGMGLSGAGIAPESAGTAKAGHRQSLVDAASPPLDEPVPGGHNILHLGSGQTGTFIGPPSGRHIMQLIMAGADRVPHDLPVVPRQVTGLVRGGS